MPFEAPEQTHEFVLLDVVETSPRLIEKQQLRAAGECAGDFREALMPITEAADASAGAGRKTDEIERGQRMALKAGPSYLPASGEGN